MVVEAMRPGGEPDHSRPTQARRRAHSESSRITRADVDAELMRGMKDRGRGRLAALDMLAAAVDVVAERSARPR
jgi:hypothetical protein